MNGTFDLTDSIFKNIYISEKAGGIISSLYDATYFEELDFDKIARSNVHNLTVRIANS